LLELHIKKSRKKIDGLLQSVSRMVTIFSQTFLPESQNLKRGKTWPFKLRGKVSAEHGIQEKN
jgi:hypothetical protein